MAEKQFHACLNLLWCKPFRVEVQSDDQRLPSLER
jgi:hypothetical protein